MTQFLSMKPGFELKYNFQVFALPLPWSFPQKCHLFSILLSTHPHSSFIFKCFLSKRNEKITDWHPEIFIFSRSGGCSLSCRWLVESSCRPNSISWTILSSLVPFGSMVLGSMLNVKIKLSRGRMDGESRH